MITFPEVGSDVLDELSEQCSHFPPSSNESSMLYNFNKLQNILQRKELFNLTRDQKAVDKALMLGSRYADVGSEVIYHGPNEGVLPAYNEVERMIEDELSGDMYIYASQWGLSVKALYYYKKGDYKKAFSLSLECIILNEYLIREGIYTLLFRAAEQNKNISRVHFRIGDWETGAAFARDLLNYLLNGEPGVLHGKVFADKDIWAEIPYVREGYAYQCFRSMVSLMVNFEKKQTNVSPDLYSIIFGGLSFDVDSLDRQIIHDWLCLKKLFKCGNWGDFIHEFIEFMAEAKSKLYDIFKITSFMDVIKVVNDSGYKNKQELLQHISKYLEANFDLNEYLNKDLSAINLVFIDSKPTAQ